MNVDGVERLDKVEKGEGDSRMCRSPGSEEQPFWESKQVCMRVPLLCFVKALVG